MQEVAGSIPGRVTTKTLKKVVMAALIGVQVVGVIIMNDCQDKWTSSTGNLHRKLRDITETLLEAA